MLELGLHELQLLALVVVDDGIVEVEVFERVDDRPGDHEEALEEHYGEGLKRLFADDDADGVVDATEDEVDDPR